MSVAPFIDHWTIQVNNDDVQKLKAWLVENEKSLAKSTPPGIKWLGLYAEIIGGNTGRWHLLLGADRYGALDTLSAADASSDFMRLVSELFGMFDTRSDVPGSRSLYRAAPNLATYDSERKEWATAD